MNTARKRAIVESAVPDVASEIADALHRVADAGEIIGGALCAIAAGAHSTDDARQKDMAGVFYEHCKDRWVDVLRKLNPELQRDLEQRVSELCKTPKKGKRK